MLKKCKSRFRTIILRMIIKEVNTESRRDEELREVA